MARFLLNKNIIRKTNLIRASQIVQKRMAPTIEDLFEFMRKDKEERAREREKDKQELKELITQGVQNEVRGLLNPLEDRVQSMENSQTNVISQLREVTEEVKVLREQLQTQNRVEDDHRAAPRQHKGLSEEVPRSSTYSENISGDQRNCCTC